MKTGLVLQGGGIRASFTAGVLDAFLEDGISFDVIGGTSAGALMAISYVSKDHGRNLDIMTNLLQGKKFLSFSNLILHHAIYDFHYLFNIAPYTDCPFSFDVFNSSSTLIYAAATSCETGKAQYFKKGDDNFFDGAGASSSLPLLSKPFKVDGHPYLDGGASDPIPLDFIMGLGVDKIVVVLTREEGFRKEKHRKSKIKLAKFLYRKYKNYLTAYENEHNVYNLIIDKIDELTKQNKIFTIYPPKPLDISHTEKDKEKITAVYELGREVAHSLSKKLKEFLGLDEQKLQK